jgi:hypothetical protein
MKLVYIAGPYRGHDYLDIDRNIAAAREAAAWLATFNIGFFCPHLHSAHFEVITPDVAPEFWLDLDIKLMRMCDAMYLLPGWEHSSGACAEIADWGEQGKSPLLIFESLMQVGEWVRREREESVRAAG